jgi:hypothetical protein
VYFEQCSIFSIITITIIVIVIVLFIVGLTVVIVRLD